MRLTTLHTTLLLLLPLLASAADDAGSATRTQDSTSTLTITRTLYTITATATSVLALTVQKDGTTLVTYPDIQKPTGTDAVGDIVLATPLSSGIGSSSAVATTLPRGTGTGVVPPSKTLTGTPIATFTGAATRGGPHVLGFAVAIGLAAGFIAWPVQAGPRVPDRIGKPNDERSQLMKVRNLVSCSCRCFFFFAFPFFYHHSKRQATYISIKRMRFLHLIWTKVWFKLTFSHFPFSLFFTTDSHFFARRVLQKWLSPYAWERIFSSLLLFFPFLSYQGTERGMVKGGGGHVYLGRGEKRRFSCI